MSSLLASTAGIFLKRSLKETFLNIFEDNPKFNNIYNNYIQNKYNNNYYMEMGNNSNITNNNSYNKIVLIFLKFLVMSVKEFLSIFDFLDFPEVSVLHLRSLSSSDKLCKDLGFSVPDFFLLLLIFVMMLLTFL